jgi:hypothetical protein
VDKRKELKKEGALESAASHERWGFNDKIVKYGVYKRHQEKTQTEKTHAEKER